MITELTSTTAKQLNKLFLNIPVHLCTCVPAPLTNKTLCLLSLFMSCVQRGALAYHSVSAFIILCCMTEATIKPYKGFSTLVSNTK